MLHSRAAFILSVLFLFQWLPTSHSSVIIIGAGAAGIAAATKLLENSITNITILEAENRIGGRIQTIDFGGGFFDIGAEHLIGDTGNVAYDMVKDYDILDWFIPHIVNIFDKDGALIDVDLVRDLDQFYWSHFFVNDGFNVVNKSVGELFEHRFQPFLDKYKNDKTKLNFLKGALEQNFINRFACLSRGSSWYDLSIQSDYVFCRGTRGMLGIWKKVGFRIVLDIMMKSYPHPENKLPIDERIQLGKEVAKINWNGPSVTVTTTDKASYTADHVIFTPSVGVLKAQQTTLFSPPLPQPKQQAINAIGFTGVVKVPIHFSNKWWNDDDVVFQFYFKKEDFADIDPAYRSWIGKLLLLGQSDNIYIWGAWIIGDNAEEVEQLPFETLKGGFDYVLHKFLGKKYTVGNFEIGGASSWSTNKHFRGSYSFTRTGLYKENQSHQRILGEPLNDANGKPTLLFGGEATHPHYYSSVHGAIETGHREAKRIIEYYKKR